MQAVCMVEYGGLRQESISRATPVLQSRCKPAGRHTTRTFQSAGELQRRPEARTEGERSVPACISHHPTVEAHDTTARTSLRLLAVLNVLFKYACARQAARASS